MAESSRCNQLKMEDRRKEYENAFKEQVCALGARAFGLGRQALVILLKALEVSEGDKIGVCGFTCLSVPEAVKVCGAKPVYLDVDEHLCIEPGQILQKKPGSLKVVILQYTFGVPGRLDELLAACEKIGAKVVEDCAHSLGCFWKGRPLGSFGEGAIYSFQWGKPYTTGRGGMLTVNSDELLQKVDKQIDEVSQEMSLKDDMALACQRIIYSKLRVLGLDYIIRLLYSKLRDKGLIKGTLAFDNGFSFYPGYIRLAGSLMSKAGLKQLQNWPKMQQVRRENAKLIEESFVKAGLQRWPIPSGAEVTMLRYPILVPNKDEILSKARKANLDIAGWYLTPVHPFQGNELAKVDYQPGSCAKAEEVIKRLIHLPTVPGLNSRSLEAMAKIIRQGLADVKE
jgi:dTDP-4-amino-4,6-dideoxygalactose transaminase